MMEDVLILDRGEFPGIDACVRAAQEVQARGWMVYIGGRSLVFDPWPASAAPDLMGRGLGVLPVYAAAGPLTDRQGTADGGETASLLRSFGIAAGSHVMLDLEAELFRSDREAARSYARAWFDAVRSAGWRPVLYSSPDGIEALAARPAGAPDAVLVAAYPRPNVRWGPPGTADADIADGCPAARGWQYTNEIDLAGTTVDLSVINFSLAGGPAVTAPIASGGLTVAGFVLDGVTHTFDLLVGGNVGWTRTGGGAGGLLHQPFADLNGPNGATAFAAWVERFRGEDRIVIKAKMLDGSARIKVLKPGEADLTKATIMEWSTPDQQGAGTFPVVRMAR